MRCLDVIDNTGHSWQFLLPPLAYNRERTELWLMVRPHSRPHSLRQYSEIPVPIFTDWFVPTTFCYCEIGAGGQPCLSRDHCDQQREKYSCYT